MRKWLGESGTPDSLHRAGLPWENGYIDSFNGKLKRSSLDPAQHQVPDLVVAQRPHTEGVTHTSVNVIETERLHETEGIAVC